MSDFSSTLTVNSLFWLTSLGLDEQGVTRRIQEDLWSYLDSAGVVHKTCEPRTAAELLQVLSEVAEMAHTGLRPALHFDMHGDARNGIRVDASGEFIPWQEFVAHLRVINVATNNNLCVVSAACFSMNAVWQIELSNPCPFFILIAPENEVSSGFVEDNTLVFYKSLFDSLDVVQAHACHLVPRFSIFHCERMLAYILRKYVREYCIGKGGRERREQLLTRATSANLVHNRFDRRRVRRAAKAWIEPNHAMVDRFVQSHATVFLMGKPFRFAVADVLKFARGA